MNAHVSVFECKVRKRASPQNSNIRVTYSKGRGVWDVDSFEDLCSRISVYV